MRFRLAFDRPVGDETCVELVRSLSGTLINTTIFGVLYGLVFAWAVFRTADPVLLASGWIGVALAAVRVPLLLRLRRIVAAPELDAARALRAERPYGAVYLAFAAALGLFAGRAFQAADVELQLLVTALVVGYAAGVSAGLFLRPWISLPAMLLAVIPLAVVSVRRGELDDLLLGVVLAALLVGAVLNMLGRYRSETEKIGMRQLLATLARRDHLTGLANRLALVDAYEDRQARNSAAIVAVHCLDLDGFKQVNDRYGHPTGDALLQKVAERLNAAVRKSDVTARLGGDEFVVLQLGLAHPSEAELMARRLVRALREPYLIDGQQLSVGVSVGYTLAAGTSEDLARLLEHADEALYQVKRQGGGSAAHSPLLEAGDSVRLAG